MFFPDFSFSFITRLFWPWYHPFPHHCLLSKDSCMPSQCAPFTAPTREWWFNFGFLKQECAKKPIIYISGVPLPKMVLEHFTICKPLKLHLWKYFAVISVQITHSHVQCALPTTPELTEFYSCARGVAKTSWHIPISFKEAPKHGNECDQSHVSSARIVFSIQTNAENNLFLFL